MSKLYTDILLFFNSGNEIYKLLINDSAPINEAPGDHILNPLWCNVIFSKLYFFTQVHFVKIVVT